jgi:hypothetical protein
LEARRGEYAGMPEQRMFEIILHDERSLHHGSSPAGSNQMVHYCGQPIVVKLRCTQPILRQKENLISGKAIEAEKEDHC